jgi:hypothetical protein
MLLKTEPQGVKHREQDNAQDRQYGWRYQQQPQNARVINEGTGTPLNRSHIT